MDDEPAGPPGPWATPSEEAAQLLHRYAEAIDDGDLDEVARLLASACVVLPDGTPIAVGADEVVALYRSTTRMHADGTPRTHHVVSNVIVRPLDGAPERYEVRARFTVLQATDAVPLQAVVAGRYRDVVARGADGCLEIIEHCMDPRLWGDVSDHLLGELARRRR